MKKVAIFFQLHGVAKTGNIFFFLISAARFKRLRAAKGGGRQVQYNNLLVVKRMVHNAHVQESIWDHAMVSARPCRSEKC